MSTEGAAYICNECFEFLERGDVGHCPVCNHHYLIHDLCPNCHMADIPKTMVPLGISVDRLRDRMNRRAIERKANASND